MSQEKPPYIRACPAQMRFSIWFHPAFITLYKQPFIALPDGRLVSEHAQTALVTNDPAQAVRCDNCLFPEGCIVRFFNKDGAIDIVIQSPEVVS